MAQTLSDLLTDAAAGRFPSPDGSVTVVPQPSTRDAGVIAFTAHSVVFTDEDPQWVRKTLASIDCDPLAAPLNPRFLTALMDRTDRVTETVDLLTVADALPGPPPLTLHEVTDPSHPRVARAARFRDDVRVWETDGGDGLLILGRAVAGRWEAAIEVDDAAGGRGVGRLLATAARHLVPDGQPVWAQQAPGNARSVRVFQAAGYRPVGAEILLLPRGDLTT